MQWKTPTALMTLAVLVVSAVAVPVLAQPDGHGRPDDAGSQADEHRNATADGNRSAGAAHQAAHERFADRCRDAYNETGNVSQECERARHVHDHAHQARRAAHGLMKAIDALGHRVVALEKLEVKFMEKLEDGNLTDNETAAFEAKLDRIQDMQNATLERIEDMEERLERIKDRYEAARAHVRDARDRIVVCHVADDDDESDGNETSNETRNITIEISRKAWPAHEAHGDSLGPCEGDDEAEALDAGELESDDESVEGSEEESEEGSEEGSEEESEEESDE